MKLTSCSSSFTFTNAHYDADNKTYTLPEANMLAYNNTAAKISVALADTTNQKLSIKNL